MLSMENASEHWLRLRTRAKPETATIGGGWSRPMSAIFELSDRATNLVVEAEPNLATHLGIAGFDHLWTDTSPEGFQNRLDLYRGLRTEAAAVETNGDDDTLARDVLTEELGRWIDSIEQGDHLHDINNIASPHQELRQIFDMMATDRAKDWRSIISRLESIDQPVDGYRACLRQGIEAGLIVARRQVEAVIEQGRMTAGESSSLFELLKSFDESPVDDSALRARLSVAVDHGRAVYAELTDWLEADYLPLAPIEDGVGAERYVRAAARYLGTEIDPEATYAWGWSEITRLWAELGRLTPQILPDGTIEQVMDLLQTDPARAATSQDEFVRVMRQRQEQALEQLSGTHFDVPEAIRSIDVRVEPAGGALGAHYTQPSEDFSRPGTVWYPVEGRQFFPLFEEATTAYHEGFPGHHLQVGVQMTRSERLSRFHRMIVWYEGSGEGWALYAEHLMGELGYLDEPDYEIGLLTSKLVRACRIAIDIGVHLGLPIPDDVDFHPGEAWTFDVAKELLMTRALQSEDMADSEITRYFGWPGQAISYKVGEQAILDLRAEAQAKPDFDAKTWHNDLLGVGSIGLDLLRQRMRARW